MTKILLLVVVTAAFAHAQFMTNRVAARKISQWLIQNTKVTRVRSNYSREKRPYTEEDFLDFALSYVNEENAKKETIKEMVSMLAWEDEELMFKQKLTYFAKHNDWFTPEDREYMLRPYTYHERFETHLFKPMNKQMKNNPQRSVPDYSIREAFEEVIRVSAELPIPQKSKRKLVGALVKTQEVLLGETENDDCYDDDPNCQFGANDGIVHYYSRKVLADFELAKTVFKVSLYIDKRNDEYLEILDIPPKHYQKFSIPHFWGDVVELSGGDELLANLSLNIFGHDVCCNALYLPSNEESVIFSVLNAVKYSNHGGDENPRSINYLPGVINGHNASRRAQRRLSRRIRNYNKVYKEPIHMVAGYHHFYGGSVITYELIESGLDQIGTLDIATLLSQALGYAYKKTQVPTYLTEDALTLYEQIKWDERRFRRVKRPKGWSRDRYNKAKALLGFYTAIIDYTEQQHRQGSLWTRRLFRKN